MKNEPIKLTNSDIGRLIFQDDFKGISGWANSPDKEQLKVLNKSIQRLTARKALKLCVRWNRIIRTYAIIDKEKFEQFFDEIFGLEVIWDNSKEKAS